MQPEPEIEIDEAEAPAEPVVLLPAARSRRELWLEVAAVFCIGVLPELWSTAASLMTEPVEQSFYMQEFYLLFRSFQVSLLVLYLMARSQAPWSRFGIARPLLIRDSLAAFGAMVTAYLCYTVYASVVVDMVSAEALQRDTQALSEMFVPPSTPVQTALMVAAAVANGFAEELVMRGYFIPRLEELLGSTARAVLLSSLLFASYHLYQGFYGAGSALVIGLVFGAMFTGMRRLWPLAAAHAMLDILYMMR